MIKIINHLLKGCQKGSSECKYFQCKDFNHTILINEYEDLCKRVALDISLGTTNCGWLFGKHEKVP
jgi:hypothetical protein